MSYPPQPPQFQYYQPAPPVDPRRAARNASVVMWLLGAMLLLMGSCMGLVGSVDLQSLPPEQSGPLLEMERTLQGEGGVGFKQLFQVMAMVLGIPGIALIVQAFFVRSGRRAPVLLGLVVTTVLLLVVSAMALAGLAGAASLAAAGGGNPIGLIVWVFPIGLLILQMIYLVNAMKSCSTVEGKERGIPQEWQAPGQFGGPYRTDNGYPPPPPPGWQPPPPDWQPPPSQKRPEADSQQDQWPPPPPPPTR